MATFRILSLDGGGIRGLLTALIIRQLHAELGILDRVNLFAGTSTGGILALSLAGGLGIDQIINLYQTRAAEVFVRTEGIGTKTGEFLKRQLQEIAKRLPGATTELVNSLFVFQDELWYPKYSGEGLRKVLAEFFPTDPTLGGLPGRGKVLVTTFQLQNDAQGSWEPAILHSLNTPGNDLDGSHVVEAALCTSAAPTFFPPHKHMKLGYCIDGGLFANNPAGVALATALSAGVPLQSMRVLSIGTGRTQSDMPIPHVPLFRGPDNYGILGWLYPLREGDTPSYPLLNMLFDAGTATSELLATQILGSAFQRVQVKLEKSIGLDEIGAVNSLKGTAEKFIASPGWAKVRDWAKANFA